MKEIQNMMTTVENSEEYGTQVRRLAVHFCRVLKARLTEFEYARYLAYQRTDRGSGFEHSSFPMGAMGEAWTLATADGGFPRYKWRDRYTDDLMLSAWELANSEHVEFNEKSIKQDWRTS